MGHPVYGCWPCIRDRRLAGIAGGSGVEQLPIWRAAMGLLFILSMAPKGHDWSGLDELTFFDWPVIFSTP